MKVGFRPVTTLCPRGQSTVHNAERHKLLLPSYAHWGAAPPHARQEDADKLTYDGQLGNLGLHSPSITLGLAKVLASLGLLQVPQYQLALVLVEGGVQQRVIVVPARNREAEAEGMVGGQVPLGRVLGASSQGDR